MFLAQHKKKKEEEEEEEEERKNPRDYLTKLLNCVITQSNMYQLCCWHLLHKDIRHHISCGN